MLFYRGHLALQRGFTAAEGGLDETQVGGAAEAEKTTGSAVQPRTRGGDPAGLLIVLGAPDKGVWVDGSDEAVDGDIDDERRQHGYRHAGFSSCRHQQLN